MTIFLQYDPLTADVNNHVFFTAITIPGSNNAPIPSDGILQIDFPDDTPIIRRILDLSQNPPILIDDPANAP